MRGLADRVPYCTGARGKSLVAQARLGDPPAGLAHARAAVPGLDAARKSSRHSRRGVRPLPLPCAVRVELTHLRRAASRPRLTRPPSRPSSPTRTRLHTSSRCSRRSTPCGPRRAGSRARRTLCAAGSGRRGTLPARARARARHRGIRPSHSRRMCRRTDVDVVVVERACWSWQRASTLLCSDEMLKL